MSSSIEIKFTPYALRFIAGQGRGATALDSGRLLKLLLSPHLSSIPFVIRPPHFN